MSHLRKIRRAMAAGKDARTDAVLDACARSPQRPELFAYGDFAIPGFLEKCKAVRVWPLTDLKEIVRFANLVSSNAFRGTHAASSGTRTPGSSRRSAAVRRRLGWRSLELGCCERQRVWMSSRTR